MARHLAAAQDSSRAKRIASLRLTGWREVHRNVVLLAIEIEQVK